MRDKYLKEKMKRANFGTRAYNTRHETSARRGQGSVGGDQRGKNDRPNRRRVRDSSKRDTVVAGSGPGPRFFPRARQKNDIEHVEPEEELFRQIT